MQSHCLKIKVSQFWRFLVCQHLLLCKVRSLYTIKTSSIYFISFTSFFPQGIFSFTFFCYSYNFTFKTESYYLKTENFYCFLVIHIRTSYPFSLGDNVGIDIQMLRKWKIYFQRLRQLICRYLISVTFHLGLNFLAQLKTQNSFLRFRRILLPIKTM